MLLFETYIARSNIDGLGVFAAEWIKKGAPVRVTPSVIASHISREAFWHLPDATMRYVDKYAWNDAEGNFIFEPGPELFLNHSIDPSISLVPGTNQFLAVRDIEVDVEITCDYREYSHKDPKRAWLNG